MTRCLKVFALFIWALSSAHANPTTVTMRSGERLIGEVLPKSTDTTLVLNSPLLGELKLPRAEIASIEGDPAIAAAQKPSAPVVADNPQPKAPPAVVAPPPPVVAEVDQKGVVEQFRDLKTPDSWKGDLRVGMNIGQGDSTWTETFLKGNLVIDPKNSRNFYRFTGSYTYRETEANGDVVKSTDRYDGNFTYRRDFTSYLFLQNTIATRVDQIRGIDRELQELLGLGVRFKPSPKFELILGGGGGVEEFEANFEDTRNGTNPVVNAFQEFTWRPFDKALLTQEFNYFVNPERAEQYNYVLSASFRYRLTDLLGIEFSYNQNFDNDVGNGNAKDDTRWRNALVVYF